MSVGLGFWVAHRVWLQGYSEGKWLSTVKAKEPWSQSHEQNPEFGWWKDQEAKIMTPEKESKQSVGVWGTLELRGAPQRRAFAGGLESYRCLELLKWSTQHHDSGFYRSTRLTPRNWDDRWICRQFARGWDAGFAFIGAIPRMLWFPGQCIPSRSRWQWCGSTAGDRTNRHLLLRQSKYHILFRSGGCSLGECCSLRS